MNGANENSYLFARSKQMWKFIVFYINLLFALLSFICMILVVNNKFNITEFDVLIFSIAGIFLSLGSFMWLLLSLQCPKCKCKPAWGILKQTTSVKWFESVVKLRNCPKCGF